MDASLVFALGLKPEIGSKSAKDACARDFAGAGAVGRVMSEFEIQMHRIR